MDGKQLERAQERHGGDGEANHSAVNPWAPPNASTDDPHPERGTMASARELTYRYPGSIIVRRGAAHMIDVAVMFGSLVLSELVLGDELYQQVVWLLVIANLAYLIGLEGVTGAALGKRVMGIRVVNDSGDPPGLLWSAIRAFFWLFEVLTFKLISVIAVAATTHRQRLGDLVTNTFVVKVSDLRRLNR